MPPSLWYNAGTSARHIVIPMDDTHFIEIQRLFALVHQRGLSELTFRRPGFSVAVKAVPATDVVITPAYAPPAVIPETATPEVEATTGIPLPSPLVGTFYRTPAPDSPPFVEIGDQVEVDQTVCIVEAMKVFNEITAEHAGIVTAIPAKNGELVQVGQTLMVIEPNA